MNFEELGLNEAILKALKACAYTAPTPIQEQAIPPALAGRDVLGCAQTGTGKTCAFGAPILQRLSESPKKTKGPRALILTPTRELALQIEENLRDYSRNLKLSTAVIFGGVGQAPQVEKLRRGVDVLTATPGRLIDLAGQGLISLKDVETFVLDEADRMLDMGFIHDVRRILALLPNKKQTLFFSATMPPEITDLVNSLMQDPVRVAVNPVSSPVEVIGQRVYLVDRKNKTKLLADIIEQEGASAALVFTRTKHGADKVMKELAREGIESAAIHGNKSQSARQGALSDFKKGKLRVLVATDIAARGIDIDELALVFNYNLPEVPETYVHRIGRTGRAGRGGTAISFCDHSEQPMLRAIEKLLGKSVPLVDDHKYPMQDFEPIVRDGRGRVVNQDDEEARSAARLRRTEKQRNDKDRKTAGKLAMADRNKKSEAAPQTRATGRPAQDARPKRARPDRKPADTPQDMLPAHPTETPEQFSRKNPLDGERIMDATARMFAKKTLPTQNKGGNKAQSGGPSTRTGAKPVVVRAENAPSARQPDNRNNRRGGKAPEGKAAASIADKNNKSPARSGNSAAPQQRGQNARGKRLRIPTVEGPRSRQKDSTEQHSLMKPFYLNDD